MDLKNRIKNAWNAFQNPKTPFNDEVSNGYYRRPDRMIYSRGRERTIVTSIFNKIALDISNIDIRHCRTDEERKIY